MFQFQYIFIMFLFIYLLKYLGYYLSYAFIWSIGIGGSIDLCMNSVQSLQFPHTMHWIMSGLHVTTMQMCPHLRIGYLQPNIFRNFHHGFSGHGKGMVSVSGQRASRACFLWELVQHRHLSSTDLLTRHSLEIFFSIVLFQFKIKNFDQTD